MCLHLQVPMLFSGTDLKQNRLTIYLRACTHSSILGKNITQTEKNTSFKDCMRVSKDPYVLIVTPVGFDPSKTLLSNYNMVRHCTEHVMRQ